MFTTLLKAAAAASWLLSQGVHAFPSPDNTVSPIPSPTFTGAVNAETAVGCFSTAQPMVDYGPSTFQTDGLCQRICYQVGMPVMGIVNGTNCWCGALLPPVSSAIDNSTCNTPCAGFDKLSCGGNNVWYVWLTGTTRNKIANLDPTSLSSTAGSGTTRTSTSSLSAQTVVVTATGTAAPAKGSPSKPNTVGIAVGVVVGVICISAVILGVIFFLRHKRRRDVEEEYKRQAAVNQFVSGGHKNTPSINDSRLDPELLQRRESTGTIADNQDYSRRILKVRNPDDF